MVKKFLIICLLFTIHFSLCSAQVLKQRTFKLSDTTGLASIEDEVSLFKPILEDMTSKIDSAADINKIKQYAHIIEEVSDTILNHIVPIFDGYNTLHQVQGETLKNISDLSNRLLDCKDVVKAKKSNQKMKGEYANLMKAK